jgi:hypothetical protein
MLSVSANQGGLLPTERATLMNVGNIDNNNSTSTCSDRQNKSTPPRTDLKRAITIGIACDLVLVVLFVIGYLFISAYGFAVTVRH